MECQHVWSTDQVVYHSAHGLKPQVMSLRKHGRDMSDVSAKRDHNHRRLLLVRMLLPLSLLSLFWLFPVLTGSSGS